MVKDGSLGRQSPMTWKDEFDCCVMLMLFPGTFLWLWFAWIPMYLFLGLTSIWSLVYGYIALIVVCTTLVYYIFVLHENFYIPKLLHYFSFRIAWETNQDPPPRSILFAPPHGIFPYGCVLTILFYRIFIRRPILGCAASVTFFIPIARTFYNAIGIFPATREEITNALQQDDIVGVCPGGVAEIFQLSHDREVVNLKNRKGLIRIALCTGASIVPCYVFGNTSMYHSIPDRYGMLSKVSRALRSAITVFWGRYLLPIAFRVPVLTVLGRPIAVKQTENPTREQIDELHDTVLQSVHNLYYEHRESYGWGDRELSIM